MQIEPRFLAHVTQDPELMRPYKEGTDLYATLASKVFKKPIEECGDGSKYRKMMKVGLLACMYGTSMFTLAKQLGITVEEASQFISDFYKSYPKVKSWTVNVWETVKQQEYVECPFGRKRRFPNHKQYAIQYDKLKAQILKLLGRDEVPQDFWNKKKYPQLPYNLKKQFQAVKGNVERVRRQAVNFLIQGASATIMKLAILEVDKVCKKYGWSLLGTIHDENLFEIPSNVTHEQLKELYEVTVNCVELSVPLKSDMEIMTTWGEGFKYNPKTEKFFLMNEKTGEQVFEADDLKTALVKYKEVG